MQEIEQAELRKMVCDVDPELLNCLLLLRYFCAGPDAKRSCGTMQEPHSREALWDMLVAETYQPDSQILSTLKYIADQLRRDLLCASSLFAWLDNSDDVKIPALKALIQQLASLPADSSLLLSAFAYGQQNARNSGTDNFHTPAQVVRWMTELLDIEHNGSVYDPCCRDGAMLYNTALSRPDKNLRLYGQALDFKSFSASQTNLLLRGLSVDLGQRPANPLLEDMHSDCYFDYILANPPFNFPDWCESGDADWDTRWQYGCPPQKNANFAWLQHILNHLAPAGRAVVLLPNGTLTTRKHAEWAIRERILRDGWVEAILALRAGLLLGTRVPCCAWVISRDTDRDTLLFVDARQTDLTEPAERRKIIELLERHRAGLPLDATEWYAAAPLAEIAKKDYILSPNLYTRLRALPQPSLRQLSDDFSAAADALCTQISSPDLCENIQKWKTAALPSDWKEFYLPEVYTISGGVFAKKEAFGQGIPMADVKTVIRHMFLPEALPARVQLSESEAYKYDLRAGDILLNRTSETVEELACCCAVPEDRVAVYGAYLKRLRPYDIHQFDSRYAAAYFRSRIYRQEVRRVSHVYTTRASINLPQLFDIRVYAPDTACQEALGETMDGLLHFGQTHCDAELEAAIRRFVETFIEKFITYPVLLFQKERE